MTINLVFERVDIDYSGIGGDDIQADGAIDIDEFLSLIQDNVYDGIEDLDGQVYAVNNLENTSDLGSNYLTPTTTEEGFPVYVDANNRLYLPLSTGDASGMRIEKIPPGGEAGIPIEGYPGYRLRIGPDVTKLANMLGISETNAQLIMLTADQYSGNNDGRITVRELFNQLDITNDNKIDINDTVQLFNEYDADNISRRDDFTFHYLGGDGYTAQELEAYVHSLIEADTSDRSIIEKLQHYDLNGDDIYELREVEIALNADQVMDNFDANGNGVLSKRDLRNAGITDRATYNFLRDLEGETGRRIGKLTVEDIRSAFDKGYLTIDPNTNKISLTQAGIDAMNGN